MRGRLAAALALCLWAGGTAAGQGGGPPGGSAGQAALAGEPPAGGILSGGGAVEALPAGDAGAGGPQGRSWPVDAGALRARARSILAHPRYEGAFADGQGEAAGPADPWGALTAWVGGLSAAARLALAALCLGALGLFLLQIGALVRRLVGERAPPAAAGPREAAPAQGDPAAEARAALGRGELAEALRQAHRAALLRGAQGLGLRWDPSLTDWEWVTSAGPRGRIREILASLVRRSEPHLYGGRPPSEAVVRAALDDAAQLEREGGG